MGLGRRYEGPVSLFDVFSQERFPFYLAIMVAIILATLVFATIGAVQLGKPLWQSVWYGIGSLAEYLNSYVSGALLMCGAVEGVAMGLGAIRTQQKVAEAVSEKREQQFGPAVPTKCPIWGTAAMMLAATRSAAVYRIDSSRAGGKYEISLQLLAEIVNGSITFTKRDRKAITGWLAVQRAGGVDIPVLTDEVARNHLRLNRSSEKGHTV